ncbi:MAG TPA: phage baseplate assembly protein [Acetobacteraceae bacterium]|nr:phage baseplate assembly protein [Acetobacteraceae bacterium]
MIGYMERLLARLHGIVGNGLLNLVTDTAGVQTAQVQLSPNDIRDNVPVAYHFGFSAAPPAGSNAVVVSLGGEATTTIVIATGNAGSRPKNLTAGQVAVYDASGSILTLTGDGNATLKLSNASGTLALTGNLTVTGDITDHSQDGTGKSMKVMRAFDDQHVHGGVTTGSGNTGIATTQD